jgi:hypothetical protein
MEIDKLFEVESSSSSDEELSFLSSLLGPVPPQSHCYYPQTHGGYPIATNPTALNVAAVAAAQQQQHQSKIPRVPSFSAIPKYEAEKYTIGIEEKFNVGTSAPLTVAITLDSRINRDDIVVADMYVPAHRRTKSGIHPKFSLWIQITGETTEGEQVNLTNCRCEKCKQRMRLKSKDEPESPRFMDVLACRLQQTRKREGASRDAIQVHFRCTPVKCHKLKSFVRVEFVLIDSLGNIVSKPNQSTLMHFRTAEKKSKPEPEVTTAKPLVLPINIPTNTDALQLQVDKLFKELQTDKESSPETLVKIYQLQQLVNFSIRKTKELEKETVEAEPVTVQGKRRAPSPTEQESETKKLCPMKPDSQ